MGQENTLPEIIAAITTKEDFLHFLNCLQNDFAKHPEDWQNGSISDFLEAAASWMQDYSVCNADDIDWNKPDYRMFAKMLYMGKIYE